MGNNENLKDIIIKQKEVLILLEAECQTIENSNTELENIKLKSELEKLELDYKKATSNISLLIAENSGLKNSLYEQIYNEKIKIVNTTAQKLDLYFKSNIDGGKNRLTALENSVKSRIDGITATLKLYNIDTKDEIYKKLDELKLLLDEKVTTARANTDNVNAAFSEAEKNELEALKNEQITDEQVRAVANKNNVERFVGLNLLNAVGLLLIIIGAITATRFTYIQLPNMLKGIMMFTLGAVMLVAGELMNRKKTNIFSLGITAGGVGVLYVALATSYFGLRILDMYPAITVCILITAVAFILSNRYNSQIIMSFALIGGYLPMFSIGSYDAIIYGAMIYFVILNLLAFMVSFSKKWRVASYIGLILNIIGTAYICFNFKNHSSITVKFIVILYVLFVFLIYTLIPIISTYRTKVRFEKSDIVLLAINTLFSSFIMYSVFYIFDLEDFDGILAIAFALIYLFLGNLVEKKFNAKEHNAKYLFYLTSFVFVVLIIPLQFGRAWLSLGWLVEGVILTTHGILNNEKMFKRVGFIISGLCLSAFLLFDFLLRIDYLYSYKYLAMTIGSLVILGAYVHKRIMSYTFTKIYKYFTIINVWFYTLYIVEQLKIMLIDIYGYGGMLNINYLISAAAIVSTFLIAYALPRINILSDFGTKIISMVLYILGILWLFAINAVISPISNSLTVPFGITIVGTVIIVVVGLISVLAVRDLMNFILTWRKPSIQWYPFIISGYFVLILTQNLITQYNLSFSSAVISIIYVLSALAWIVFGFIKRYPFIRKFGLCLAILAVLKLFLIDLSSLTQGYKIVSYFVLGTTLVAISFVYQYFSNRLELKEAVSFDAQNND